VPGAGADTYLLREVALDGGARVLAGIHFYGGDVAKPFVGVLAQTRALTAEERLAATDVLCDAFAALAPAAVWWWVGGHPTAPAVAGRLVDDQRLLMGSIPELVGHFDEPADAPFTLRRDDSAASYDAYVRLFEAFVAANQSWRGRLARSERDAFEACAGAGGLFVVEHRGRMAGVFAARPGEVHGIPGWLVEEELLGDALRGRGLAPTLQRMALARLDTSAHTLVMGTIHAANAPSLRTARRVGRSDVGAWVFVRDPRRDAAWLR
jgi:L-amino acid N-acyltransferase YncA